MLHLNTCNDHVLSAHSLPFPISIPAIPKLSPTKFNISTSNDIIHFSWNSQLSSQCDLTNYNIYKRKTGDNQTILITKLTDSTTTNISVTGIGQACTSYEFKLTAVNSNGESDLSDWKLVKFLGGMSICSSSVWNSHANH
jgi:hypothetical protein